MEDSRLITIGIKTHRRKRIFVKKYPSPDIFNHQVGSLGNFYIQTRHINNSSLYSLKKLVVESAKNINVKFLAEENIDTTRLTRAFRKEIISATVGYGTIRNKNQWIDT